VLLSSSDFTTAPSALEATNSYNPLNPVTKHLVNTCVFDKDAKLLKSAYTARMLRENNFDIKKKKFVIFFPRKGILSKLIFLEKYLHWLPIGGQYFIVANKKANQY